MQPVRFHDDKSRKLIGHRKTISMSDAPKACPALWVHFSEQWPIARQSEPYSYGVNCQSDMTNGTFEYMVAVEVPEFLDTENWDRLILPEAHYAVFPVEGVQSDFGSIYQGIFGQWLPNSGYEMAETPIFERYGPGYDPETRSGDTEIWVPVKAHSSVNN